MAKRKAYRRKPVRTPPLLLDVTAPPVTDRELEMLRTVAEDSLSRIQLGSKNTDDFLNVFSLLDNAYVLAVAFTQRYELQLLALLAKGALLAIATQTEESQRHLTLLTAPAQTCIDTLFDAQSACERSLLVKAHRYAMDNKGICRVNPKALWYVDPSDGDNESLRSLLHVRSAVFQDGYVRTGYLEEEDGRFNWVSPLEDFKKYPVTEPIVVLIADSVRKNHDAQEALRHSR